MPFTFFEEILHLFILNTQTRQTEGRDHLNKHARSPQHELCISDASHKQKGRGLNEMTQRKPCPDTAVI